MFSKKDKAVMRKENPIEKSEIKAFLGPGSQFEGKLIFDEIVRLDGTFRGEVTSKDTLIVGETADLQAEIIVGSLILSGRFKRKHQGRPPSRTAGSGPGRGEYRDARPGGGGRRSYQRQPDHGPGEGNETPRRKSLRQIKKQQNGVCKSRKI